MLIVPSGNWAEKQCYSYQEIKLSPVCLAQCHVLCWRQKGRFSSGMGSLAGATAPLLSPCPTQEGQVGTRSERSIMVAHSVCPNLVIPSKLPHPSHVLGQSHFLYFSHTSDLLWLVLCTLQKSLKGLQTPNKHQLALGCPVALDKWSQAWQKQVPVSICIITPIR